jgi:eukaryotic-like serine/threonine-protein kinase
MEFDHLGPYRIGKRIGRGGMGTVYQGQNVETGQVAAIKVLSPRLAVEEGFRERFETEIETLKKLKHPNIVRLYGFGEQEGHLYYVMELVEGTNLENELQAGRRFNWRETTHLGIMLAKALKHAHDHGVIHRDLKPANLLLTGENDVKLADFGIARLFGNTRITSDGGLVGTAEYMAPEQADGRPVTFHCDLYSLGGVLFAMLTGRPPFKGGSLPELLQYHRFSEPPHVSRFAADVPEELDQMIVRLLSKDPQARATNALVVAKQLGAMEHALSLPQSGTGRGERVDHAMPEDQNDSIANDRLDARSSHGETDATEPDQDEEDVGAVIHMARTQADPQEDHEAVTPKRGPADLPLPLPKLALGPGDELPDPSRTTAAAIERGNSAVMAGKSNDSSATLLGAVSQSDLANDERRADHGDELQPVSRFTTVEDDERRRAEERLSERGPAWAQVVALAASLVAILGLAWYLTRPPSPDKLFQRIEGVAADERPDRLLDAEDDIHQFLSRFPDDPRAPKLKNYLEEIDLLHLERRLQRLPRQLVAGDSASPIERDYLEAIGLTGTAPQRAAAKLQAIVDVYGSMPNPPENITQFVELTRRKLNQLREQSQREAPDYLAAIDRSLREAERLRTTDPAKARSIWSGIVELYADKPWAAERVSRAESALRTMNGETKAVGSRQTAVGSRQ